MTDLTEQWKKGELPNGWYYVRLIRGEHRIDLYINEKNEWIDCPDNIIDTVVCEVPSYEDYVSLKKFMVAGINAVNSIRELEKENEKLKSEYEKECHRADELEDSYWKSEKENTKLKDLLKRCYAFIDWCELGVPVAQRPILMKDINKALGEDK